MSDVSRLLGTGQDSARTAQELATLIGCDQRTITVAIERDRRAGVPICATSGANPGYYLAADAGELTAYCNRLTRRAEEILRTLDALVSILSGGTMTTDTD